MSADDDPNETCNDRPPEYNDESSSPGRLSRLSLPVNFVPSTPTLPPPEPEKSSGDAIAALYRQLVSDPKADSTSSSPTPKSTLRTRRCESCDMDIPISDFERHVRGTAHMVSAGEASQHTTSLMLNANNVGFKMLQSQGWEYEKGLGAEGTGRRQPIGTILKHDKLGLGHQDTGQRRVTHSWEATEASYTKQRRKEQKEIPSGKELARRAKKETRDRVRMMRYMED
ncbi:hypothetical protein BCR43DRAFT_491577 [Syncephalastrum racemosum]|uniref:G-patch domain-containing protein n=1 Tax=Syncephalastrum racemosum TaxID=13706 RepID=A0A1X2HC93_SYNRA|nr:hypothetical protein BCR43DRAFT_491577 [Syncephalastrum racemosum]